MTCLCSANIKIFFSLFSVFTATLYMCFISYCWFMMINEIIFNNPHGMDDDFDKFTITIKEEMVSVILSWCVRSQL